MLAFIYSRKSKFNLIVLGSLAIAAALAAAFVLAIRLPQPALRFPLLGLILAVLAGNLYLTYYMFQQIYRPIHTLIQETEETLQGLRQGEISLSRDDEIGLLANNFNQIILDAQMKRMELETSNLELASHAEIIEKTYRELDKKVYDLFTLFNIGKELNSTLSMDSILKITCFTSMGQLGITAMNIMLMEPRDSNHMVTVYSKGSRDKQDRPSTLDLGEAFLQKLHLLEHPLMLSELEEKPAYAAEYQFFSQAKLVMVAPLLVKKNVIGLMIMGPKLSREEFTQGEKDFVNTLGSLAAIALENARLYEQAITDGMTKLYLKRYFQLRLDDEIRRADRYHSRVTLMMMDIDHFKPINDTHGHTKGDEVLIAVAKAIKQNFRDVDIPARYGGEEFATIMPEVTKEEAMIAAERLRKTIAGLRLQAGEKAISVTISIGVAEYPRDAKTALQLIESSDAALYRSKQNGRNQSTLA